MLLTATSNVDFLTDNLSAITGAMSTMFTTILSSPAAVFLAIGVVGAIVGLCFKTFRGGKRG